jgi:tetratricopeptide (TPR) repeat protein
MTGQKTDNRSPGRNDPAGQSRVVVGADEIAAAVTALAWAARWDTAARLLSSAQANGPGDATSRRLALAAAALAVHHDFRTTGPRWAPGAMAAAESAADPGHPRRLDLLRLQYDYETALTEPDGSLRSGPEGRDPARLEGLADRAEDLARELGQGDGDGAGWAAFYRGLIADNLLGDRDGAPPWFTRALDAAERDGDEYLAGEALRHLGDHDEESGDLARARARWERSAELWAGIGNVTGVLAQQLLLAGLACREGNPAAGTAIAAEVSRWAGAAGLARYRQSADELIASQGPEH